jgi:hypothetical protein
MDILTVKYDSIGNELWSTSYDGPGGDNFNQSDVGKDIAIDEGGNTYVIGWTSCGEECWYFGTISYSPNGQIRWVDVDSTSRTWKGGAITIGPDGYVYVTGGASAGSYITIKYNSEDGYRLWTAIYQEGSIWDSDEPVDIAVDATGNVYVTGTSCGSNYLDTELTTIKYDPDGDLLWEARYDGVNGFDGIAIALDGATNVYVIGGVSHSGGGITIKYDTDGNEVWAAAYNEEEKTVGDLIPSR